MHRVLQSRHSTEFYALQCTMYCTTDIVQCTMHYRHSTQYYALQCTVYCSPGIVLCTRNAPCTMYYNAPCTTMHPITMALPRPLSDGHCLVATRGRVRPSVARVGGGCEWWATVCGGTGIIPLNQCKGDRLSEGN